MHAPPLVGWLLVLLCAAAGAYCLVRARTGPDAYRGDARGEGLMALGMAAMALPASAVTPPPWSPWMFTAAFAAAGVWALARRHLHHAVGTFAMVYMALAMTVPPDRMNAAGSVGQTGSMSSMGSMGSMGPAESMGAMGAMEHAGPGGVPLLTGLLLAYYTVYVIAAGVRLVPVDAGPPGVLRACRVAMGIGMLAMLLAL
ncbi:DUF5134 domain-containing protein [Streptomyces sp. NPDC048516]|uniref:DUF5134 domain-containing protein n=1 Tax=Streptomyces sp. NPDC048516 TaxID=3365565 RepID=UPI003712C6FC